MKQRETRLNLYAGTYQRRCRRERACPFLATVALPPTSARQRLAGGQMLAQKGQLNRRCILKLCFRVGKKKTSQAIQQGGRVI